MVLADDFDKNGPDAIRLFRQRDPGGYSKMVFNLHPKKVEAVLDANVTHSFQDATSVEEIIALVAVEAGEEAAQIMAAMFKMPRPMIDLTPEAEVSWRIDPDKPSPEVVAILQDSNRANIKARLASCCRRESLSPSDWQYIEEHAADDVLEFVARARPSRRGMSASLIGRLGSSAFRLSTTAMSMSLTGSCFSSESTPGSFQHGIRGRGGTIF